jgi:hypothetical protein
MANYLDPYAAELQGIQRQQKLAEMLMNQQQPQEQMVSGRVAPINPLQAFLPALNTYQGMNLQKNAEADTKKLADLVRGERQNELKDITNLMFGSENYNQAVRPEIQRDDMGNVMPNVQEQVGTAPNIRNAYSKALLSQFPEANALAPALYGQLTKQPDIKEVAAGGSLVGIKNGVATPLYTNPKEVTPTELQKDYEYVVKNFGYKGSPLDFKKELAQASRPVTNVNTTVNNTDKKQIFDLMKDAKTVATGAVQQIDAANNIINALDTNKVFTGTGANVRLEGARIADSLGISGKDTKEKLANTGTTIKSLASLALQGAQLMSGQGAITQGERQLASDAMSGRIDFTPAELRQLANAAKRSGEFIYSNYNTQLKSMSQDPDFKKVMPYYQVPLMTPQTNPNQIFNAADKIINGG